MGCACKKPKKPIRPVKPQGGSGTADADKSKTQSFRLETRSGATLTFGSRLEADAANARQGYTGKVKPI